MQRWIACLPSAILMGLPFAARGEAPKLAVRADGYLGYSHLESHLGIQDADGDAFQGGGSASASAVFDRLYTQLDVFGDKTDFDVNGSDFDFAAKSVGVGGRVGWRDAERGSLGFVGLYDHLELDGSDTDAGRIGLESELFLDRVTLSLDGGDAQFDDEDSGYLDGRVAFYPTDRWRLDLGAGAFDLEEDDQTVVAGAGGEVLLLDVLSAFVRWEASFFDSTIDVEQHSVLVGARLYWGAETPSLVAYDRQHFKRSCGGYRFVARLC